MITSSRRLINQVRIFAKQSGAAMTISLTDYPAGKPDLDPVTKAPLLTLGQPGEPKAISLRAFAHTVSIASTAVRFHQEIEVGDVIVDFVPDIVRVDTIGTTSLVAEDYHSIYDFNAANRVPGVTAATATPIILADMDNVRFTIQGKVYAQKKITDQLAASWDAILGDIVLNPYLLTLSA